MSNQLRLYAPLAVAGSIVLALFASLVIECTSGLTPDEAEKQLDVACGVLARAVAEAKSRIPSALLTRVCEGRTSRLVMERMLEGNSPGAALIETFPFDPSTATKGDAGR